MECLKLVTVGLADSKVVEIDIASQTVERRLSADKEAASLYPPKLKAMKLAIPAKPYSTWMKLACSRIRCLKELLSRVKKKPFQVLKPSKVS